MNDEVAFLLPATEVKALLIKSGLIFVIALVALMILYGEVGAFADIGLFLAFFHVGIYFYMIRYKYIFVAPDYIRGEALLGRNVIVSWGEPISIHQTQSNRDDMGILGLSGYELRTKKSKYFIFIPKAIAESQDFQAAVVKFAPTNHPLLSIKAN